MGNLPLPRISNGSWAAGSKIPTKHLLSHLAAWLFFRRALFWSLSSAKKGLPPRHKKVLFFACFAFSPLLRHISSPFSFGWFSSRVFLLLLLLSSFSPGGFLPPGERERRDKVYRASYSCRLRESGMNAIYIFEWRKTGKVPAARQGFPNLFRGLKICTKGLFYYVRSRRTFGYYYRGSDDGTTLFLLLYTSSLLLPSLRLQNQIPYLSIGLPRSLL